MPRRRHFLLVGVSALVSLAPSCPRIVDLVVINRSTHALTLVITRAAGDTADPNCGCPDGLLRPQLATGPSIDEIGVTKSEWVAIDTTEYQYRADGSRIELTVPPHFVLRVDQALAIADRMGPGRMGRDGLAIQTLELKAQGQDQFWTQAQLVNVFKLRKRSLFVHEVEE